MDCAGELLGAVDVVAVALNRRRDHEGLLWEGAGLGLEGAAERARGTSVRPAAEAWSEGQLSAEPGAGEPLLTVGPCLRAGLRSGAHLQANGGDEVDPIAEAWAPDRRPAR